MYPKIPAVVGGGQPVDVKIMLVQDDNYKTLRGILSYDDNQEISQTVSLITTTDENYVIVVPSDVHRIFLLPKGSVSLLVIDSK